MTTIIAAKEHQMLRSRQTWHRIVHQCVGAALAALVAVSTSACSGGISDVAVSGGDVSATGTYKAATSGELHIYTWAGYMPDGVIKKFEHDTGISLTVDTFDSNEALEAKLQSTGGEGYDIVMPSDYMVKQLIAEKLLMPFDASTLPNVGNIKEQFRKPYYDKTLRYSVPYEYGTTGIVYDASSIPDKDVPRSWKEFFHPAASLGKSQLLDDQVEVTNAALRAVGADQCSTNPDAYQRASEMLHTYKRSIGVMSSEGVADRLASGEQKVGMAWSYDAYQAMISNKNLRYLYPSDGTTEFVDNVAMPRGAKNIDQAKTFINYMLDPHHKAPVEQSVGAGSVLIGGDELLPQSMRDSNAIVPSASERANLRVEQQCSNTINDNYSMLFEDFRR
ncbi:MAG: spermidine/putrescine ABC transporter substrate-binding protein [Bifidobacterium tibiigranuli]|jgi:spermidine/putrescine transport system substrate-binding protein|uniref:ABC transporter substrate-binding protein n=1 Tax=Bifidobacterium tibiigranuli TaxID=2172043 RepID=UPI0026EF4E84|nr:spermidine/putrescine ABC transporter substrate-binding protein [Bifidobacterium tibiigranuli]MCI1674574.1 spermidine/putrescine ABC transporter substrate-binding protein [Bifidobacterium tibiigranuli]MCI1714138.1 spermidine/putrescine ABC transporter substrate-binding protein [Bifidobacterium tibiigranuli]